VSEQGYRVWNIERREPLRFPETEHTQPIWWAFYPLLIDRFRPDSGRTTGYVALRVCRHPSTCC